MIVPPCLQLFPGGDQSTLAEQNLLSESAIYGRMGIAHRQQPASDVTRLAITSGGNPWLGAIGQARGNANGGASVRHVMLDHRACADPGEIADADAADDRGPAGEQDSVTNSRRAIRM